MQATVCGGSKEVERSVEGSVDHGCGDSVAKRESGYWLLDEGT